MDVDTDALMLTGCLLRLALSNLRSEVSHGISCDLKSQHMYNHSCFKIHNFEKNFPVPTLGKKLNIKKNKNYTKLANNRETSGCRLRITSVIDIIFTAFKNKVINIDFQMIYFLGQQLTTLVHISPILLASGQVSCSSVTIRT